MFVDSEETLEQLADAIARSVGAGAHSGDDPIVLPEPVFHIDLDDVFIEIGRHDFDSDRDMPFEKYLYDVVVFQVREGGKGPGRDDVGRALFSNLKTDVPRRLLLSDDLQEKLGEYGGGDVGG